MKSSIVRPLAGSPVRVMTDRARGIANRLKNGTFDGGADWVLVTGTGTTFTEGVARVVATTNQTLSQNISGVPAGATLTLKFDIPRRVEGQVLPRVRYTDGTFSANTANVLTAGSHEYSIPTDPAKTVNRFDFRITLTNSAIDLDLDNAVLV
jgi:hypothetical protein